MENFCAPEIFVSKFSFYSIYSMSFHSLNFRRRDFYNTEKNTFQAKNYTNMNLNNHFLKYIFRKQGTLTSMGIISMDLWIHRPSMWAKSYQYSSRSLKYCILIFNAFYEAQARRKKMKSFFCWMIFPMKYNSGYFTYFFWIILNNWHFFIWCFVQDNFNFLCIICERI